MGIVTLIALSVFVLVTVSLREIRAKPVSRKKMAPTETGSVPTKSKMPLESREKERGKEDVSGNVAEEKIGTRPVRLCITGFGSFGKYPGENPSSMTARHLHGRTLSQSPSPISSPTVPDESLPAADLSSPSPSPNRKIEITFVGPVDVTYERVKHVVAELHQTKQFDAFVHVGVGHPGELRIERRSRRVSYDKPGSDDQLCEVVDVKRGTRGIKSWPEGTLNDEIWSKIDCEALVGWLRSRMGVKHVMPSSDAGLYLCEYIYGTSLSQSILNAKPSVGDGNGSGGTGQPAPVLFVHVPNLKTDTNSEAFYTESEVSEILERVCWWVGSTV